MGEGELRCELQNLVAQLELQGRVHFPGLVQQPYAFLRRASLFAMASRFEGFPYSLLEAMACGVAAIYTDCPSGPSEIIRDGIDGVLVAVGDTDGLANALHTLMSNHGERARLAQRALEVQDRFGIDRIMAEWQTLIAEVTGKA
jgi:glycosyltransferase involved in cell wall biosynthesis